MKKFVVILMTTLLLVSMLVGCAAMELADNGYYAEEETAAAMYPDEEYSMVGSPYGSGITTEADASVVENRKLIRTLYLTLETETYTELLDGITQRVNSCGGYIESMNADTRYASDNRYASMTIRIPVTQLEAFVGEVAEISNVVQRSESTEDVTLSYVDMETHRDALEIEQERLLALLENADNLTDILEIESRLTDVRYELERMESQLRTYDNLIDYATVYLDISEVQVLTPTEEKGFWEEIGDGFINSMKSVWEFLKEAFAFLIVALPYLLLIAAIVGINLLIVLLCVRGGKKRARRRREKAEMNQQPPEEKKL